VPFRQIARELLQNLQTIKALVGSLSLSETVFASCFSAWSKSSSDEDAERLRAAIGRVLEVLGQPGVLHVPFNWAMASPIQLEHFCLQNAALVFSTVSCAVRSIMKSAGPFDLALIDEAAQLVEAETTIILRGWPRLESLVLIGDHLQLPATVMSRLAKEHRYDRSLFELLKEAGHPSNLLDTQYRMHREVSVWPRGEFYQGKVLDGYNVADGGYNQPYALDLMGPYAFIDAAEGQEESEPESRSKFNMMEVDLVLYLLRKFRSACKSARVTAEVGVISPYKGQVAVLQSHLGVTNGSQLGGGINVEIQSVDGFQGREKDVIIFSAVRANRAGNIGFLQDHRRLNVAITRAKYALWIVGNAGTLKANDEVWRCLVEDAVKRGLVVRAGSHQSMQKVVKRRLAAYHDWNEILKPDSNMFNGLPWKVSHG
jgi:superfamily I DNA and/or RNA helicase